MMPRTSGHSERRNLTDGDLARLQAVKASPTPGGPFAAPVRSRCRPHPMPLPTHPSPHLPHPISPHPLPPSSPPPLPLPPPPPPLPFPSPPLPSLPSLPLLSLADDGAPPPLFPFPPPPPPPPPPPRSSPPLGVASQVRGRGRPRIGGGDQSGAPDPNTLPARPPGPPRITIRRTTYDGPPPRPRTPCPRRDPRTEPGTLTDPHRNPPPNLSEEASAREPRHP